MLSCSTDSPGGLYQGRRDLRAICGCYRPASCSTALGHRAPLSRICDARTTADDVVLRDGSLRHSLRTAKGPCASDDGATRRLMERQACVDVFNVPQTDIGTVAALTYTQVQETAFAAERLDGWGSTADAERPVSGILAGALKRGMASYRRIQTLPAQARSVCHNATYPFRQQRPACALLGRRGTGSLVGVVFRHAPHHARRGHGAVERLDDWAGLNRGTSARGARAVF